MMKKVFVILIAIALAAALTAPAALGKGKRSRGGRKASSAHAKGAARSQSSRGRAARGSSRGREARGKASRGRGERVARRGKLSRRERREMARDERGGRTVRERVVVRGRHGRRVVRYRYVRRHSEAEAAPVIAAAPRPTGSGIPPERVSEIQNALIKAGYLGGPASGQYDDATIQAMKQFQSANGFAETGVPSAPALKKLGVAKRSNDGYAMPVTSVREPDRKQHSPQSPE